MTAQPFNGLEMKQADRNRKHTPGGGEIAARDMTHAELHAAAQGCTEPTCPHHGAINEVRRERGIR